jgi:hypothetical protein
VLGEIVAQPEARLQRKIQDAVKRRYFEDIFIFKVWGSEHMMAGLPDLIGCIGGKFFGLEVKMPDKRDNVSRRQAFVMGRIKFAGGKTGVVTSPEDAIELLDEWIAE